MSRNNISFLIILLLCTEWTFSYNHINNAPGRSFQKIGRHGKKTKIFPKGKNRKGLKRQDFYYYERSPVDFDLASFIQPEDEFEDEAEPRHRNKNRKRIGSKNKYELNSLIDLGFNDDKAISNKRKGFANFIVGESPSQPYMNINNPLLTDDLTNRKKFNPDSGDPLKGKFSEKFGITFKNDVTEDETHSIGKKSAFKHLKIPFFSHNSKLAKTDPSKPSKKKLFCFNCPKKNASRSASKPKPADDLLYQYKIKRSYQEKLCPACQKKYIAITRTGRQARRKKATVKIIHNSRQFYEQQPFIKRMTSNKVRKRNKESFNFMENQPRQRRDSERDRQLKELAEVERKIENVDITARPAVDKQ